MRAEKVYMVDGIKAKLGNLDGFVVASNVGMAANREADLRSKVLAEGGEVLVSKKRLFMKAFSEMGVQVNNSIFSSSGATYVVSLGDDAISTIGVIASFAAESGFCLLGGMLYGGVVSADEIKEISELPPLNVMRSEVVYLIVSIHTEFLSLLDRLPCEIVDCLDQRVKNIDSCNK